MGPKGFNILAIPIKSEAGRMNDSSLKQLLIFGVALLWTFDKIYEQRVKKCANHVGTSKPIA